MAVSPRMHLLQLLVLLMSLCAPCAALPRGLNQDLPRETSSENDSLSHLTTNETFTNFENTSGQVDLGSHHEVEDVLSGENSQDTETDAMFVQNNSLSNLTNNETFTYFQNISGQVNVTHEVETDEILVQDDHFTPNTTECVALHKNLPDLLKELNPLLQQSSPFDIPKGQPDKDGDMSWWRTNKKTAVNLRAICPWREQQVDLGNNTFPR